jgi:hypothetical protein
MMYPSARHTIVTLPEVDSAWRKLHKELVEQQHELSTIELMRLAYYYAVFTIAPSYAEKSDAATCPLVGPRTHVSKMGEGPHEQAHR